ncbi:MAG: hypothetical protein R3Y32_09215 [Bacillota bacterium]
MKKTTEEQKAKKFKMRVIILIILLITVLSLFFIKVVLTSSMASSSNGENMLQWLRVISISYQILKYAFIAYVIVFIIIWDRYIYKHCDYRGIKESFKESQQQSNDCVYPKNDYDSNNNLSN